MSATSQSLPNPNPSVRRAFLSLLDKVVGPTHDGFVTFSAHACLRPRTG